MQVAISAAFCLKANVYITTAALLGAFLGFFGQFFGDHPSFWDGDVDRYIKGRHLAGARPLVYEEIFLEWLLDGRGEAGARTAVIVGWLGASYMFAADRFRQSRKAKKEAAV
jgi:hypothetical protein